MVEGADGSFNLASEQSSRRGGSTLLYSACRSTIELGDSTIAQPKNWSRSRSTPPAGRRPACLPCHGREDPGTGPTFSMCHDAGVWYANRVVHARSLHHPLSRDTTW